MQKRRSLCSSAARGFSLSVSIGFGGLVNVMILVQQIDQHLDAI
jgi:hypothetical protein